MKYLSAFAALCLAHGCSESPSTGSGNPSSSSSNSKSSKPYMSELLRKYSATGNAREPYGLWEFGESFTSEDGIVTVTGYWRITKDSLSLISACINNENKKYTFAPTMAAVSLNKENDGSYSASIPRLLETEVDNNGLGCRSSIKEGSIIFKVDEREMLLAKSAGDVQFQELRRVK